jgi:hypothetical protein
MVWCAVLMMAAGLSVAALAYLALIELHTPNAGLIYINPLEITAVRPLRDFAGGGHFARGTRCVVVMTNGNFNGVTETCEEVRDMLQHTQ